MYFQDDKHIRHNTGESVEEVLDRLEEAIESGAGSGGGTVVAKNDKKIKHGDSDETVEQVLDRHDSEIKKKPEESRVNDLISSKIKNKIERSELDTVNSKVSAVEKG